MSVGHAAAVVPCAVASHGVLRVLADWWSRPDPARVALWSSTSYTTAVESLWQATVGADAVARVSTLLSALASEGDLLVAEYERLFVGPARLPCPPYEAVWRRDRPRLEQGTVNGRSTGELHRLYLELGLRLRPNEVELADHIAVELEALAYAVDVGAVPAAVARLQDRLASWVPAFCAAVASHARCESYRALAEVTMDALSPERVIREGDP